jgi:hypothetical protein
MLKLTYTETGFRLERLNLSLETWVAQRVTMTVCAGQKLFIEPSQASFLLPAKDSRLLRLEQLLSTEYKTFISLALVDDDCVEVNLKGSWIAESSETHEGLFITTFSDAVELCVYRLWHSTQATASFLV